jgi:hypothetical protein
MLKEVRITAPKNIEDGKILDAFFYGCMTRGAIPVRVEFGILIIKNDLSGITIEAKLLKAIIKTNKEEKRGRFDQKP